MKKSIKTWAMLAAAVTALAACQKEKDVPLSNNVEFTVGECEIPDGVDPETRTYFDLPSATTSGTTAFPTLWTGGEGVSVFYQARTGGFGTKECTAKASSDHKTATLAPSSNPIPTSSLKTVYFMMISPASAVTSAASAGTITVAVPTTQTPATSTPDQAAMILGARTSTYSNPPSSVTFSPKHMTAYMCLTLANASSLGTLQSVTVTSTVPLSGSASFSNATTPTITAASSGTSNSVTATTSNLNSVWFATLPAEVAGTTLTITAKGSSKTLTREITVPSGKNLEAGKIALLSVDMNPTVAVTGVTVSPTTLTLEKGKTSTLTATVTPSNATDKTVTWSSSNTSVATVTSAGVVKGVAVGSATITATTNDGGKKATCAVTVTAAKATKVEILNANEGVDPLYDVDALHITPTQPATIQYKVTYSDGTTTTNSGATLSVYTGSGVSVSGRTVSCTAVSQTATIKVAATSNTSAFSVIDVNTWSDPTSVSWQNPFIKVSDGNYAIVEDDYYINATVSPSTARQKVVLEKADNTGGATLWSITGITDKRFKMFAYSSGLSASEWPSLATNFKISAWHKSSVKSEFTVKLTTIDVSKPKMFDFVAYNSSTGTYQVIDGGCRVLFWTKADSNYDYTWSGVKDFYAISNTLSVPSGYKVVGIVTAYFKDTDSETGKPSTTGLVTPSQLVTYGPDGTKLASGEIHGFAISIYNAVADIWSQENDDVDWNENWSRELWPQEGRASMSMFQSLYNQMNGFNLTIAAHQYNVWRGSSHAIRPADRCWDYGEPGKELTCYAFPNSNPSLTFIMRPWFVPTVYNWLQISDANGKFYGTDVMNKINAQITKVGFGDKVFPYSTDSYWTINTYQNEKNYAYVVYSTGYATRAKSGSAGVRPFLIF